MAGVVEGIRTSNVGDRVTIIQTRSGHLWSRRLIFKGVNSV